jgi:hypothetical protein
VTCCLERFEGKDRYAPYLDTSAVGGIRHATIGIGFDLFRTCITKLLAALFYTTLCMSICSANGSLDQEKLKKWDF